MTNAPSTAAGPLTSLAAHRIVELLASGDVSAREAVEQHIARIEAIQPTLNAVATPRYEAARAEADEADGRRRRHSRGEPLGALHGLPVTVKDCLDVAGLPSTFGVEARAGALASADERHVARLRAAGAIVVAKSNVAQFLAFFETDNPLFGRTANPWDATRSCGGSSGGEAALVAAGGSALGLGTDVGGSVRNPATWCGVASLKPSAGRLPEFGTGSFAPGQDAITSEVGVIARTVADVALGIRTAGGQLPLGDPAAVDVGALRVGVVTSDGLLEPGVAVRRAVRESAGALAGAGADTVEWTLPDPAEGLRLFVAVLGYDRLRHLTDVAAGGPIDRHAKQMLQLSGLPRRVRRLAVPLLSALGQHGLASALQLFDGDSLPLAEALPALERYRRRVADRMAAARIDAVLLPASPVPAVPHGGTLKLGTLGSYTPLWNVLGYPAGVVPWTTVRPEEAGGRPKSRDAVVAAARAAEVGSAGLPVGVQLVATHGRDDRVLALMSAVEQASVASGEHPGMPG